MGQAFLEHTFQMCSKQRDLLATLCFQQLLRGPTLRFLGRLPLLKMPRSWLLTVAAALVWEQV